MSLGITIALAESAISRAYRRSEAAFITPFEYVALPLSVVWGFLVFGERPESWAMHGIAIIIISGMVLIWREAAADKEKDGGTGPTYRVTVNL